MEGEKIGYNPIEFLKELEKSSDEIPAKVIIDGEYKVRNGFWIGLVGVLQDLIGGGMLNDDLKQEALQFITKYNNKQFYKRLKTAEDIAEANALIDKILDSQK